MLRSNHSQYAPCSKGLMQKSTYCCLLSLAALIKHAHTHTLHHIQPSVVQHSVHLSDSGMEVLHALPQHSSKLCQHLLVPHVVLVVHFLLHIPIVHHNRAKLLPHLSVVKCCTGLPANTSALQITECPALHIHTQYRETLLHYACNMLYCASMNTSTCYTPQRCTNKGCIHAEVSTPTNTHLIYRLLAPACAHCSVHPTPPPPSYLLSICSCMWYHS